MKILLVLIISVFLSGCFPGLSNGPEGVSTKPGEFAKGKAVKGFPQLPLYPEAKIIESYGSGNSYGASAYTEDEIGKVVAFYETSLEALGWETTLAEQPVGYYNFDIKNQKQKGSVIVNRAADGKTVAITLSATDR